ncbi:MAG: SMC family ATPase [Caldilineaceae bacterium]|nr:SMC family ATPase [Caldilineaceae bacterium]
MIPQRVSIQGFLSYRNQVEFFFDNAPIWMLTGENGAGKSTVFDAISFALYGVHRGGKVNVDELINRRCDHLAIEFDFMLGDDCYRVQRAVPRRGGATYQALHLSGPNPPIRNRPGPQRIVGTDSKTGLTEWVQRQLGLDEDAFKMAVLLEQGKGDALLSAKPAERHALLSQLVDLSRYEALEKRTRDRQNEAKLTVQRSKQELSGLARVSDAEIAAQQALAESSKMQVEAAQARLGQLQALMVHAERWGILRRQREEMWRSLEVMRSLIIDTDQIEAAALRLAELQTMLPALRRILHHQEKQVGHQREATHHHQAALQFAAKVTEITPLVEESQQEMARLQQERDAAQDAQSDALQRLHDLATPIHQLTQMINLRQQIAQCDAQLANFAPDLDRRVSAAQGAVEELVHLKTLWPYIQRYAETREQWHEASAQLESSLHQQEEDAQCVTDALRRVQETHAALTTASEQLGHVQHQKTIADYELNTIRQQLSRFEQVGGEPACPYCGQPLSAEHLSRERARLETMLTENERKAATAARAESAALQAVDEAKMHAKAFDADYHAALKAQRESAARGELLIRERSRLENDGWQALASVRAINGVPFPLPKGAAIDLCFVEPEPTPDNLALLNARTQGYETAQATLQTLQQKLAGRERHLTSRQQWDSQLQPLAILYPEDRAHALLAERTAAEQARDNARATITRLSTLFDQTQARVHELEAALQRASSNHQAAAQEAVNAERMAQAEQAHWEQGIDALPSSWQEAARQVNDAQLATWQNEVKALQGADQRHEELRRARDQKEVAEKRLAEVEGDLATIPFEAQQEVAKLEQEETAARICQRQGEETHQHAVSELRTLQDRRRRIDELTTQMLAAEKRATHCEVLVKYLGRDYLQRFLLQQAETTIVSLANGVLDNCSGGTLSMELRPNEGAGGISQKAFDLMVENRITQTPQDRMLPVWLLSGSQRFRVAISLALAIGQYASHNGQRIESVIIDEGFGSLDQQGLRDMEEALRGLEGTIKRIILVSHQEEFAKAFPHRYRVWLEDGASHVKLADELEDE